MKYFFVDKQKNPTPNILNQFQDTFRDITVFSDRFFKLSSKFNTIFYHFISMLSRKRTIPVLG